MSENHQEQRQLVASRIKQARRTIGMDTLELARALGVSRREINYLEVGRHQPHLRTLAAMARLTGRSVEWLMGEEAEGGRACVAKLRLSSSANLFLHADRESACRQELEAGTERKRRHSAVRNPKRR